MKHLSDDTLRRTREQLIARGNELADRLKRAREDLVRAREPLPRDSSDAAVVIENDEVLQAIEDSAQREMICIENALHRLNSGTFGICEGCGSEIEEERLRIVPLTTHCRRCAVE